MADAPSAWLDSGGGAIRGHPNGFTYSSPNFTKWGPLTVVAAVPRIKKLVVCFCFDESGGFASTSKFIGIMSLASGMIVLYIWKRWEQVSAGYYIRHP